MNEIDLVVLIPDRFGLVVVDLDDLVAALAEGLPLEAAIEAAAFDTLVDTTDEVFLNHVDRVRKLNATGDADLYWE